MAVKGNLVDMPAADLIQQACQDRKSARLMITHRGQTASLFFRDGGVQHATLGKNQGEEVVYQVLGWEDGTFTLEPGIEASVTTITRSWSGLLMEGAQRLDEAVSAKTDPEDDGSMMINTMEATNMAQKLDEVLKEFAQEVPGLVSASVIGMDGLDVATYVSSGYNKKSGDDLDAISAQLALLLKLVDTSMAKLKSGTIESDMVTTDRDLMMLRFLPGRNFFLGVIVDRKTANMGNLRLMSQVYCDRLSKVLPR